MNFLKRIFSKRPNKTFQNKFFEEPQKWNLSKTDNNGNPMIVLRNEASEIITRFNKSYPINCGIVFKLLSPRENGLPNLEAEPRLKELEQEIFEVFESDFQSIVPVIVSTSGVRQYIMYTNNLEEYYTRLNKIKIKFREYNFITCSDTDINWETYQSFS